MSLFSQLTVLPLFFVVACEKLKLKFAGSYGIGVLLLMLSLALLILKLRITERTSAMFLSESLLAPVYESSTSSSNRSVSKGL